MNSNIFKMPLSIGAALLKSCPRIAIQNSVYPDEKRKSYLRRYFELFYLRFKHGTVANAYNALGLDISGRSIDGPFFDGSKAFNYLVCRSHASQVDYSTLLADKYLFALYLSAHHIPVVVPFAHSVGGKFYFDTGCYAEAVTDDEFLARMRSRLSFMVKPLSLNCGRGIKKVEVRNSVFVSEGREFDLMEELSQGEYIFQDVVVNCPAIARINPTTLNTCRIATARMPDGVIELWDSGLIRVGRSFADVDNFHAQGIAVGIDAAGTMKKSGFTLKSDHTYQVVSRHPDSGIVFEGYKIPDYKVMVDLVIRAHELFPHIPSIGWDVALTECGPVLIEGNHDWDVELMGIVHRCDQMPKFKKVYGV